MLLAPSSIAHAGPTPATLLAQEQDTPHGVFGDRDARGPAGTRRSPPGCGLFGRLSERKPPEPANGDGRPRPDPRGRA